MDLCESKTKVPEPVEGPIPQKTIKQLNNQQINIIMKFKHLLTATALMLSISVVAQPEAKKDGAKEDEGFKFTTVKELPVTSIKDQNQAGTCWCYSSLAFFEAELLRMGDQARTG